MLAAGLLILGAVTGQHHVHEPCETPLNFEAQTYSTIHESAEHKRTAFGTHAHFQQDGERHRLAMKEFVEDFTDDESVPLHRIFFHPHNGVQGVEFRIDLKTKHCTQHTLEYPFRPIGIPDKAHYGGQQYIGSSGFEGGSVLTDFYSATFEHEHGDGRWEGVFTQREVGCFPVWETFENREREDAEITHTNFYDNVRGISDPNAFEVPDECFQNEDVITKFEFGNRDSA